MLLFQIKSQPGVAYKSVSYIKKAFNAVLNSSKHEEIIFSFGSIFVFIPYCQKKLPKVGGFGKNTKRGVGHTRGLFIEEGVKTCTLWIPLWCGEIGINLSLNFLITIDPLFCKWCIFFSNSYLPYILGLCGKP